MSSPDLIIPLSSPRSYLSFIGIVLVIGGVWHADRTWDEKGSLAYERAKTALSRKAGSAIVIPTQQLDQAFPMPILFLVGWMLYGAANLFSVTGGSFLLTNGVKDNLPALAACAVSLALGWIASVPMGEAVRYRDAAKKQTLSMFFVASWLLLSLVGGERKLLGFRAVGAMCIIASMKVLWKFRKMGDTWEKDGVPNPNPIVYNAGGPMFVMGWFFFWVGMAASSSSPSDDTALVLPIYFSLRSALAFIAGCGMVPVVLFLDYAHDEGAEFTGFGTDGRFFGRFLESPVPFLLAWTMFGVSALLPMTDFKSVTKLQWIILVNCVLQGIDAGVLIQTALYKGDMAAKNRWSVPFVLLFLALAIEIGLGAGGLAWFALLGAFFIVLGQKTVFGDRKRGDYWMINGEVNPNPIVYSAGEPIFMLGWIIMWLTISMPVQ